MHLHDYVELWRVARQRSRSEDNYRRFQSFQAKLLLRYLAEKGISVVGRRVLDLGSGVAGYSQEFSRHGASVISLDLARPNLMQTVDQLQGSALAIPLPENSMDVVFCASLIEHVAEPERVLTEAERVMKPEGFGYFSFPPYYSPMGGHEYAPFHYLSEKVALRLVRHQAVLPDWVSRMHTASDNPSSFADLYQGWGLYRMTICKFRKLLKHTHLICVDSSTRYLPMSFIRWPVLGEVLTWHAQFVVQKPPSQEEG